MAKSEKEKLPPMGDITREAIDALKGYVYQIGAFGGLHEALSIQYFYAQ
jgi:hypothetical protein